MQAALKAAMDEDLFVNMYHLEFARDKVLMGKCSCVPVSVSVCVFVFVFFCVGFFVSE